MVAVDRAGLGYKCDTGILGYHTACGGNVVGLTHGNRLKAAGVEELVADHAQGGPLFG